MSNKKLNKAKDVKNDEFYTLYEDIENELKNYKEFLEEKIIYCNCDNPEFSNFWKYFIDNFHKLKLKKVISTYISDEESYKTEYDGVIKKTKLKGNGDFRSDECIEILKECDILITNPPFSLFREYVDILIKNNKKFIIIGGKSSISYKDIFKNIKENTIKIGFTLPKKFSTKENKFKSIPAVFFTNLNINKNNKELELTKKYNPIYYPKYDNYDAINYSM